MSDHSPFPTAVVLDCPVPDDVVLLARQPILDAAGAIHGHELLFRRADGTGWPLSDESRATAHVLVAAFADLTLEAVTDGTRAWVNTPRRFLLDTDLSVLPAERVVLEILERDVADAALVDRARELAGDGFALALDDFTWHDDLIPLLEVATYVKLDVRDLGLDGVAEHMRRLAPYDVRVVAEKVETTEERDGCRALGIELYQGYFFERPCLVRGRPAPSVVVGRLSSTMALGEDSTFEAVEQVMRLDAGLSIRLLRCINSAAIGVRHRVTSLRHALVLLGTNTVRQWLVLALLGDLGSARPAVLEAGLVRARLCEALAPRAGAGTADSAFIVGLLSVCDALLDTPLHDLIPGLPLAPEISRAIVGREGPLGDVLEAAIAFQHGETMPGPEDARLLADAIHWADEQLAALRAGV